MSTMVTEFVAVDKNFKTTVEGMINKKDALIAKMKQELRQSAKTGSAHQRHGKQSSKTFQMMGSMLKMSVIGPLVGLIGPAGVLMTINQLYASWLDYTKQIGQETRKMTGEVMAFLALQEAGKRAPRLSKALSLAAAYGVTDRGEAIDTIQAMQSVWGSFERGMKASKTVFAASRLDVPVALGKELEVFGQGAGLEPGQAIRYAHVAGKLSGRTPKALAQVAPALSFFEDPAFAFAMGTALTKTVKEGQLGTYTRRGGMALMSTSGLGDWFKAQGLGKASQFDRLRALSEAGMDTIEELEQLGLGEIREQKAIVDSIRNLAVLEQTYRALQTQTQPGIFLRELGEIEEEVPFTKGARRMDTLGAMAENAAVFGPAAEAARSAEESNRARALAIRQSGLEFTWLGRTISGEGKDIYQSLWDKVQLRLYTLFEHPILGEMRPALSGKPTTRGAIDEQENRILSKLDDIFTTGKRSADALETIAGGSRGPLSSPTEDN